MIECCIDKEASVQFVKGRYFVKNKIVDCESNPLFQRCLVNPKTQQIIKIGKPDFWETHDKEG